MAMDQENRSHILVGLGGTGGKVLKAIKKRIYQEFPDDAARADLPIGFVYVDSTREMMKPGDPSFRVLGKDASFTESEFVDIKSVDLNMILDNVNNFPGLKHIVKNGASMRHTLGEVGAAAGQKRRAGRILFASNCQKYLSALANQYGKVKEITHKDSVHIHIFTGLAGGTGSGSIVDVAAQTRLKYPAAIIDVYAMLPELDIPSGCQAGRYHQNGYAALRELNALNVGSWLPCDVISGAEHVALDTSRLKQFGLTVYSNVNENGVVVNSFTELPRLLADTVYFRMFMTFKDGTTSDLIRSWSLENINDFCVEYSEKSKAGDRERVRTKAINSFGIKRVIYPEERIVEHVTYTVSQRLIWQMQFNNYKDDLGFVSEPVRRDYSEYTRDEGNLREWKLDDSHLTLNEKILETDKKVTPVKEFWDATTNFFSYDEAKNADKSPLKYLQSYCEEQFLHHFRLKQGVEEYYKDKSDDRVLKEQAQYIVECIEKSLYTQWYEGKLSMNDLLNICNEILIFVKTRTEKLEGEIAAADDKIKQFIDEAAANVEDWTHAGVLSRAVLGKSARLYTDHQQILADLYAERTLKVARQFQMRLLSKLRGEFELFHEQITLFIGKLVMSQTVLEQRIADRNRQNRRMDVRQSIIEVSEDDKMVRFEEELVVDKTQMDTFAGILRHAVAGNQPYAHFDDLAKRIDENTVSEIAEQYLHEQISVYHDNNRRNDRIMGINILQQLQKVLATETDIRNFASSIIEQSGVFLKLDDSQLSKALKNNPNPVASPESINRKTILVTLPNYEGDDGLKSFAGKLEAAMRSSFGNATPGSSIQFDTTSTRKNEITIVEVKYCFPMRAISWLPQYEREYDGMVKNPNETEAKDARILLHSEGDGTQLAGLMGEEKVSLKDMTPYFFIAAANNILQFTEDHREEKGWCVITLDEFDSEIKTLISKDFTGLSVSEELTQEMQEDIIDKVKEVLANPDLRVSEREAMLGGVKAIMRDYVARETSGPQSPKYKEYADAARKAMEMINRK